MCRLLGLVANKPVDFEFSLERFKKKFAKRNPHGWGIGWYANDKARVCKQRISAKDPESKLRKMSKAVRSKIIIAHVRKKPKKGAPPSEKNSHPFRCKNWVFAHNGLVDRKHLCSLLEPNYKEKIEGETDSEVYFYWILQNIEKHQDVIRGMKDAINEVISKDYTGLNFLLSDGTTLYTFSYSSTRSKYYTLYKLRRDPSDSGPVEYQSTETMALLRSKSLRGEKAVLVCSERLTEEKWEDIKFGHVLIVKENLHMKDEQIL